MLFVLLRVKVGWIIVGRLIFFSVFIVRIKLVLRFFLLFLLIGVVIMVVLGFLMFR